MTANLYVNFQYTYRKKFQPKVVAGLDRKIKTHVFKNFFHVLFLKKWCFWGPAGHGTLEGVNPKFQNESKTTETKYQNLSHNHNLFTYLFKWGKKSKNAIKYRFSSQISSLQIFHGKIFPFVYTSETRWNNYPCEVANTINCHRSSHYRNASLIAKKNVSTKEKKLPKEHAKTIKTKIQLELAVFYYTSVVCCHFKVMFSFLLRCRRLSRNFSLKSMSTNSNTQQSELFADAY